MLVSFTLCSVQGGEEGRIGEGRGFEGKGRGEGHVKEGRGEGHGKEGRGEGHGKEGRGEGHGKEGRGEGHGKEGRGRGAEIKVKGSFGFQTHGNSDFGHSRGNHRGFGKGEAFGKKGKFEGGFKRGHGAVVIAPAVAIAPAVPCPPGRYGAMIPAGPAQIGQAAPTNIVVNSNTDGSVDGGNGAADGQASGDAQGAPIVGQALGTRRLAAINKHRINGRA